MQEKSQGPEKRQWASSVSKARARVDAARDDASRSERARGFALGMLEEYAKRVRTMVARGELGSRKAGGEAYTGSMSLLCFEVDYGSGARARVGAWARMRAVWESCSLPLGERLLAWRRALGHGSESQAEKVWMDIRACLKVLSADLAPELEFGGKERERPEADFERHPRAGEGAWDAWVAAQGPGLVPLSMGSPAAAERLPTEHEWAQLGSETQEILDRVARGLRGEPSRDEGKLGPAGQP